MFEIRNRRNDVEADDIASFEQAKKEAQIMHDADKKWGPSLGPFTIYEVKQVWTTSTLDEAIAASGIEK